MSKPTGILHRNENNAFYYPIPHPLSYSAPAPGTHVVVQNADYYPHRTVEVVTLTEEEKAELQPVGLYSGGSEYVVLSPETMLKHLQLVALALAKAETPNRIVA